MFKSKFVSKVYEQIAEAHDISDADTILITDWKLIDPYHISIAIMLHLQNDLNKILCDHMHRV